MSDEHLNGCSPAGQESAVSRLDRVFRKHAGAMYAAAFRVLQDTDDAQDAAHEVFRKLSARLRHGTASGWDNAAYLARAAHNEARLILRRRRASRLVSLDQAGDLSTGTPVTALEDEVRRRFIIGVVRKAVAELPARKRLLVQLRYHEDHSRSEAAEALGISIRRLEKLTTDTFRMMRATLAVRGMEMDGKHDLVRPAPGGGGA